MLLIAFYLYSFIPVFHKTTSSLVDSFLIILALKMYNHLIHSFSHARKPNIYSDKPVSNQSFTGIFLLLLLDPHVFNLLKIFLFWSQCTNTAQCDPYKSQMVILAHYSTCC